MYYEALYLCFFLAFINKMLQYHCILVILCNVGEVYIFEHGRYVFGLEHIRVLVLSN